MPPYPRTLLDRGFALDPRILLDRKSASRRVAAWLLALVVLVVLAVRAVMAFDPARHEAAAMALLYPTDPAVADRIVTRLLLPEPGAGLPPGAGGEFRYDPEGPLSVFTLHGLPQPSGDERYLVYVRDAGGSALAGAVRPDPDGSAIVRFAGEPQPHAIFEVLVTRAIDDADSSPHGEPLLRWFDPAAGRAGATPWVVLRR